MNVFVDTSALYALLDADDPNHPAASEIFARLRESDPVTHNYVAVESSALVAARLRKRAVRDLHEGLLPVLTMHWVDASVHAAAVAALLAARGRPATSLVDETSFEVMRRLGIETAFAYDRDFARAGFRVVA